MAPQKIINESKPKKRFLDFSKIQFSVNWASGITILSLLIYAITMYLTNKSLQSKVESQGITIESQGKTIEALGGTVNTLKGSQDVFSNAMQQIMLNSPGELKYRIEQLEKRSGINSDATPNKQFQNSRPQ